MSEAIEQHTLADLASTINTEHELVYDNVVSAVEHAIACGMKLLEAKDIVPEGSFERWCLHNVAFAKTTINRYMRLATYRERLSGPNQPKSISSALISLRGLGSASEHRAIDLEEAKGFREIGATYDEIGSVYGVTGAAVWQQLNPNEAKEASRRKRRKEAIKRRARIEAKQIIQVETVGGAIADAYALLQDAAEALQQAVRVSAESRRTELERALTYIERAEAAIVKATKQKGK